MRDGLERYPKMPATSDPINDRSLKSQEVFQIGSSNGDTRPAMTSLPIAEESMPAAMKIRMIPDTRKKGLKSRWPNPLKKTQVISTPTPIPRNPPATGRVNDSVRAP